MAGAACGLGIWLLIGVETNRAFFFFLGGEGRCVYMYINYICIYIYIVGRGGGEGGEKATSDWRAFNPIVLQVALSLSLSLSGAHARPSTPCSTLTWLEALGLGDWPETGHISFPDCRKCV